ncbi:TPA: helix-turn-helix domain-containing protein, partial [Enterococcus faecium]|nr:helix-turn-helix domain-containing protein [Enterococcus faecium]HBM6340672.1 helix-turn-helix domain-containing protein [Enterococcus faecium]
TPISSVNNWLRGVSLPNKNRLLTIANIGNTSVDWIKWGTLEEYIASYLIDSGYELYIKDFPEIPYKVFKDIQEKYSDTFSLDKDYELLNPIIKFTIGGVTLNRIKFYIDSSKKTIKQISTETGINYTTLTNYYRGERNPRNTETWNILADYFHVPVSYLMGLDETNVELKNLNIGNNIKNIRKSKNMTQTDFAELMGLSRSYIGDLENNRSNPSIKTLEAIARALDVPIVALINDSSTDNIVEPYESLTAENILLKQENEELKYEVESLRKRLYEIQQVVNQGAEKMIPNLKDVSKRIKYIRKKLGMTMEQFGSHLSNSPKSTIATWESGRNIPSQKKLQLIAIVGETTTDWIKWGTLEEYITSYLIGIGYELYIKDFPEIPHKVFKDIQEKYSDTFSLDKDYELLDSIIKNIFTKYYSKEFEVTQIP